MRQQTFCMGDDDNTPVLNGGMMTDRRSEPTSSNPLFINVDGGRVQWYDPEILSKMRGEH